MHDLSRQFLFSGVEVGLKPRRAMVEIKNLLKHVHEVQGDVSRDEPRKRVAHMWDGVHRKQSHHLSDNHGMRDYVVGKAFHEAIVSLHPA